MWLAAGHSYCHVIARSHIQTITGSLHVPQLALALRLAPNRLRKYRADDLQPVKYEARSTRSAVHLVKETRTKTKHQAIASFSCSEAIPVGASYFNIFHANSRLRSDTELNVMLEAHPLSRYSA